MRKQNSTKRTIISLTIAFSLSILVWSIQVNSESESNHARTLEAKVYPEKARIFER